MNDIRCSSQVYPDEMAFVHHWRDALLGVADSATREAVAARVPTALPFAFRCGERTSADILKDLHFTRTSGEWIAGTRGHTLAWRDTATGLVCQLELTEFAAFPALEWVVRLTNAGPTDTPALTAVHALALRWCSADKAVPVLHRSRGSDERPDDFQYLSDELRTLRSAGRTVRMDSGAGATCMRRGRDGRSSVDWLPFLNLQTGADGVVIGIGWSGQWFAEIAHDGAGVVDLRAGMEYLNLSLRPGESIRTPRILALYWRGETIHGQNVLRRFMLEHAVPRIGGRPAEAPVCNGAWGGTPTAGHLKVIERIRQERLPYDYYWVDAGWYGTSTKPCPDVFHGEWGIVGDWRVNRNYHPDGLRPVRDAVRQAGMKFLLWIEPERATAGTAVTLEHPDWFLSLTGQPPKPKESLLLNLGHPDARRWALETVDRLINEIGIDCYREDFNVFGSLEAFLAHDPPGRQGITEVRFIEGLYAFWDELRHRHPDLLIDNCASGGRRIDLETLRRSIPLWRTDYTCFPGISPDAIQVHSCGLAHWVPLNATSPGARPGDTYHFRSALSAGLVFSLNEFGMRQDTEAPDYPWDWHRKMMAEYRRARPCFCGDFYPLMSCALAPDTWLAYQLHRPDADDGLVLTFRRPQSPLETARLPLRGLTPDAAYEFEDADSAEHWQARAGDLAEAGMELTIAQRRQSRLVFYRRSAG